MSKIKGHNSGTNERKITCNKPNPDIVNINTHKTFGENLKILSVNEFMTNGRKSERNDRQPKSYINKANFFKARL